MIDNEASEAMDSSIVSANVILWYMTDLSTDSIF